MATAFFRPAELRCKSTNVVIFFGGNNSRMVSLRGERVGYVYSGVVHVIRSLYTKHTARTHSLYGHGSVDLGNGCLLDEVE